MYKILIADDDKYIRELVAKNLELDGFETVVAADGQEALDMVRSEKPDLIVLDVMMPKIDGFRVCKALKDDNIPIIMLTAKGDINYRLAGLETGADDYITKPFDSRELLARIKVVFRRLEKSKNTGEQNHEEFVIANKGISIDTEGRVVYVDGEIIRLTPKEYDLLTLFVSNPGKVFSRDYLLNTIWDYTYAGDSRTVDIHVQRLRKKLLNSRDCIETVFGVGYKYTEIQ